MAGRWYQRRPERDQDTRAAEGIVNGCLVAIALWLIFWLIGRVYWLVYVGSGS